MYIYKKRVSFYENDGMQVVWHGNYVKWFEDARVAYFNHAGLDLRDLLKRGIVFPILKLNVSYLKPAKFAEQIEVRTYLRKLDRASVYFEYEVYDSETGDKLTIGNTLNTFTSVKTGRIVRVPKELMDSLMEYSKEDRENG